MFIISKISDWWFWHWQEIFIYIMLLAIIGCMGICIYNIMNASPRVEQIRILAEGKLINIRATGAWNIYDTELKFDDGSMLLMTYSFCRTNQLKTGENYKIWESSFYGYCCKEK